MTQAPPYTVHIVADEEALRDSLAFLFTSRGIATRISPLGEAFLAAWPQPDCGCIILDVRMEGSSGPQVIDTLFDAEGSAAALPPVIFLMGHADLPLAVQSLKRGAFDFLEMPFNDNQIVDRAIEAIALHHTRAAEQTSRADLAARFATLSDREDSVMRLIVEGKLIKQIADQLCIAIRTVEVHRARVPQKTGTRNCAELSRMQARLR